MKFNTDEIVRALRSEIDGYHAAAEIAHVGRVVEVGDGIAQISGLSGAMSGEMLVFEGGQVGQVFNLDPSSIGAVVYGDCQDVKAGQVVRGTGRLLEVPVGEAMFGRVVDPLGRPLDRSDSPRTSATAPVECLAPGVAERQPVNESLLTGLKAVDAMMPIGRGQRELIIGDRKTGKTAIAVDAIINQKRTGVICVYVAIGQKESTLAGLVEVLRSHGAMEHTVVVSSCSSDPAPLQYVAPYAGCAIAEYFMRMGRHTLIVYDDLSKQAAAYRQISLLLRRPPGREAYPGDIFYLHSRLLERSCKLAERYVILPKGQEASAGAVGVDGKVYVGVPGKRVGLTALSAMPNAADLHLARLVDSGGSMTALPICETQEGQVEAYIPTNLISITDGQIYLEPRLFYAGVRPAVNVGISVSRVGYKAASKAMKEVAKSLRLDLAAYRELETFSQLGMDLDASSQQQLDRGARMVQLLVQQQYSPMCEPDQIVQIFAGTRGLLDDLPVDQVRYFLESLVEYVRLEHADVYGELAADLELPEVRIRVLAAVVEQFKAGPWMELRKSQRKTSVAPEAK